MLSNAFYRIKIILLEFSLLHRPIFNFLLQYLVLSRVVLC
jgi:hypothetical protein